jgi:hypothetical protein
VRLPDGAIGPVRVGSRKDLDDGVREAVMVTTTMQCATHPDVETGLRCSRCDVAICPKCLVQTPVGARCRTCARLKRPPMYEISASALVRGIGASAVLGGLMGVVWGLLFPHGLGFFFLLIFFIGPPIGYFFADVLGRATNRKRGPVMQGIAVAGLVFAFVVKSLVSGGVSPEAFRGDLFGIVLLVAACIGAITRLR